MNLIWQSIKMALAALNTNKMRAFLTVLGVIIGVIAVVVLTSLGQGAMDTITGQIQSLGTNMLVAQISTTRYTGIDVETLEGLVGQAGITAISPAANRTLTAKAGTNTMRATLEGVLPAYFTIRNLAVDQGRPLVDTDTDMRLPVCVVGVEVADELFKTRNVLGNTVSVSGHELTIVGVLEPQGTSMMGSEDRRIMIPFTLAQRILKQTSISSFFVSTANEDVIDQAEQALDRFLSARTSESEDYTLINQSAILDIFGASTATLTLLLSGIAGISLLVGGIGIMNIMLVSVTERTREIGIRKAIGAQRSAILIQFLVEAVVLSLVGGLLGVGLSWLILTVLKGPMGMPGLGISSSSLQLALSFSTAIGILFGIYPANKASKLKPIDALRYE